MVGDQYIRHQFVPEGAVSAGGRYDQVITSNNALWKAKQSIILNDL